MLKEIIILVLVLYLLSRVVRFLLPIFRISSAAHSQMRKMQQQMNEMENNTNQAAQPSRKRNVKKDGDYIDYEEIK